jgi:histidine triad (HIT) family protein
MSFEYDDENIFAKILRGDIPNKTVVQTDHTLAFEDLYPQAPHHILVIPKGEYTCFDDFCQNATAEEIVDFHRVIGEICVDLGIALSEGGDGYRVISNAGEAGHQDIPHYHMHILAGRDLGRMVNPA